MWITWRIWGAINRPPRYHAIFRHMQQLPLVAKFPYRWAIAAQLATALLGILLFMLFPSVVFVSLLLFMAALPLLVLLFNGSVLGALWTWRVSQALAHEIQSGRFDLMSISARGPLGVSWLICTGCLHRGGRLRQTREFVRLASLIVFAALLFICLLLAFSLLFNEPITPQRSYQTQVLETAIPLAGIALALWLDHVQSIVIAALLGMVMPFRIRDTRLAHIWTLLIYGIIQLSVYVFMVVTILVLQILFERALSQPLVLRAALVVSNILIFYMLREALIGLLWRMMLAHFDAYPTDFDRAMR